MGFPRVIDFTIVDREKLLVTFTNGDLRQFNLAEMFDGRKTDAVDQARISAGGNAILWPDGFAVTRLWLLSHGTPVTKDKSIGYWLKRLKKKLLF
ncbi:MAG TPA: DUF2442 domain-containing protein [Selenomonadales bacterium]|nr:DUF2442 domain-containing protein [Selenomonadales bacterium]